MLHCAGVFFLFDSVLPFQVCAWRLWSIDIVCLERKKSKFASCINIYSFIDLKWNFTWKHNQWPQLRRAEHGEGHWYLLLRVTQTEPRRPVKNLLIHFIVVGGLRSTDFSSSSPSRFEQTFLTLKKGWDWKFFGVDGNFICLQHRSVHFELYMYVMRSEETVVQVPEFCKTLAKKLALNIV